MIVFSVKREINIMRLLSHPHIVRLYEVIETRSAIYLIMEYMECGELFDYITENGKLEEDEARHFFQQVAIVIFLPHKTYSSFCHILSLVLLSHVPKFYHALP